MITIRLLGGAKKAVGKPRVDLDRASASVAEILQFLVSISSESSLLNPNNLIVAINGVDSSALQGRQSLARSGDTVTVVTVVHGGADYTIDGNHVLIIGIRSVEGNAGKLVDRLRSEHKNLSIQALQADAVYGTEHPLEILRMTLEIEKRKIMLANSPEVEFLLRLACTDQISEAIERVGLKSGAAGCFVVFSQNREELGRFSDWIQIHFEVDDSTLEPSSQKKAALTKALRLKTNLDDDTFLKHLLERAAILVK